jgi:hypothetical protein
VGAAGIFGKGRKVILLEWRFNTSGKKQKKSKRKEGEEREETKADLSLLSSSFFVSLSRREVKKESIFHFSVFPFLLPFSLSFFSLHHFILFFLSLCLALLQSNNEEREIGNF